MIEKKQGKSDIQNDMEMNVYYFKKNIRLKISPVKGANRGKSTREPSRM